MAHLGSGEIAAGPSASSIDSQRKSPMHHLGKKQPAMRGDTSGIVRAQQAHRAKWRQ